MITFEQALDEVTKAIPSLGKEKIPLADSLGRVLAQNVSSDIQMPPFDKAAVDGFACRRADLEKPLEVVETIAAGKVPQKTILEGKCAKIMTGAMLPEGADCVVMVEETELLPDGSIKILNPKTKNNIAYKAEDIQSGEVVLQSNTLIAPQHQAVMAAVGATEIMVYQKARVTVFSTGDELVEPEQQPEQGKIRNSNGIQLVNQADRMGCEVRYGGIIPDTAEDSERMIREAYAWSDVILLSGGISMGEFDFIPTVLQKLQFDIKFKTISVQPGKPTVFGRSGDKFVMALPGNPISSFNIFELLAKPMIYRLMGLAYTAKSFEFPLAVEYKRKRSARLAFIPAILDENGVNPVDYHGSAHINALSAANVLFEVPIGTTEMHKGDKVHVRFI
ncbi:MAG: molybdopterin molybdotransferase MoeA [Bacteroidales bacterium]|jgi:molybdopterin molybdotransferase|nr:molybdopterin molybdotransferase MoeA [Bacteroidales bacterium]